MEKEDERIMDRDLLLAFLVSGRRDYRAYAQKKARR
jgi:hypothetical protein